MIVATIPSIRSRLLFFDGDQLSAAFRAARQAATHGQTRAPGAT
jgi:hypothetical protein